MRVGRAYVCSRVYTLTRINAYAHMRKAYADTHFLQPYLSHKHAQEYFIISFEIGVANVQASKCVWTPVIGVVGVVGVVGGSRSSTSSRVGRGEGTALIFTNDDSSSNP